MAPLANTSTPQAPLDQAGWTASCGVRVILSEAAGTCNGASRAWPLARKPKTNIPAGPNQEGSMMDPSVTQRPPRCFQKEGRQQEVAPEPEH